MHQNPFESIDSAYQYVGLLLEQVREVERSVLSDAEASDGESRRLDALRLVDYKLKQLAGNLTSARRALNDLRTLHRLLLGEREESGPSVVGDSAHAEEGRGETNPA